MVKTTVEHVARYIIEHCGSISAMKLEKLTFYCQAWSLAWDNVPLFDDEFEAWANGPVSPNLYSHHRGMFILEKDFLNEFSNAHFTEDQIDTMNIVLKDYGDKAPFYLSELTHKENPWKDARKRAGASVGEPSSEVITKDEMLEYYGGLASI